MPGAASEIWCGIRHTPIINQLTNKTCCNTGAITAATVKKTVAVAVLHLATKAIA